MKIPDEQNFNLIATNVKKWHYTSYQSVWLFIRDTLPEHLVDFTVAQWLFIFLVKRVPDWGPEWREPNKAVHCLQLAMISGLGKTTVRRLAATVWRFGAWWYRGSWIACQCASWFVILWWWSGRPPLLVTTWSYFRIFLWGEKICWTVFDEAELETYSGCWQILGWIIENESNAGFWWRKGFKFWVKVEAESVRHHLLKSSH